MMRALRIVALAAVVGSLACLSAVAGDLPNPLPIKTPLHQTYLKTDIWKDDFTHVSANSAGGPDGASASATMKEAGPVLAGPVSGTDLTSGFGGSAIPMMGTGLMMMTKMERTEQQIRRVIRRLE